MPSRWSFRSQVKNLSRYLPPPDVKHLPFSFLAPPTDLLLRWRSLPSSSSAVDFSTVSWSELLRDIIQEGFLKKHSFTIFMEGILSGFAFYCFVL